MSYFFFKRTAMDKKEIRHFLKPHWKKFILPLIFGILFLILVSNFQALGAFLDKYTCESEVLYSQLDQNKRENKKKKQNKEKKENKNNLFSFSFKKRKGGLCFSQIFFKKETTHACMVK